jgi:hypothetical protein
MRRWTPGLSALGVIALAVLVVQLVPWSSSTRGDFAPFMMTITGWSSARMGFSDGRVVAGTSVHHLEYKSRENWTLTLVSDEIGGSPGVQTPDAYACRHGLYGHLDSSGGFHVSNRPTPCPGPSRWIGYGMASSVPWERSVADGIVTYTNTGERVSFDLNSGLPILYEGGLSARGTAKERSTFVVEPR